MDWPIELALQNVPELLIIHSKVLNDLNAPWRTTARCDTWGAEWIQFSAADGAQNFINMIFFDVDSVKEADRHLFTTYHSHLLRTEHFVCQYSAASGPTSFADVSSRPVIRCRFHTSIPQHNQIFPYPTQELLSNETAEEESLLTYRLISSSRGAVGLQRSLRYLRVEPHHSGLEPEDSSAVAPVSDGINTSQQQILSSNWLGSEVFRAVASSQGLLSQQPPAETVTNTTMEDRTPNIEASW